MRRRLFVLRLTHAISREDVEHVGGDEAVKNDNILVRFLFGERELSEK